MLGHVQKKVFQAATPNTSAAFTLPGDSKAFGGSVYMPGATAAKLEFSIDGGATWIGPAAALTTTASGFFSWSGAYFTMPYARVVATAGTATDCRVYVVE
jgi:hypothetical protein